MSGVSTEAALFCPVCLTETPHLTDWQSEEPDTLDVQCVPCLGPRWVSGRCVETFIRGCVERRVVPSARYGDVVRARAQLRQSYYTPPEA